MLEVSFMPTSRSTMLAAAAEEIFSISVGAWHMRHRAKARWDLSEAEFLTLDVLARDGTMTVGRIQKHIGVLPAQMSRIIRSLEHKFDQPLIACSINAADKRKVDVQITEFGRLAHSDFREGRMSQTATVLSRIPDKELAEFMRVIRLIRQSMDAPVS